MLYVSHVITTHTSTHTITREKHPGACGNPHTQSNPSIVELTRLKASGSIEGSNFFTQSFNVLIHVQAENILANGL